jgi:hypothetical protein
MNQKTKKFTTCLLIKTQGLADKAPKFTVTLNGVTQHCSGSQDNVASFDMLATLGHNILTIDLTNKNANDTVVDHEGKIVEDLNIQLFGFKVEQLDATDKIKQQAKYLTCDNQLENTNGFMHKNGRLTIEFQCPFFYFLRDCVAR